MSLVVLDTNILMDAMKHEPAQDVSAQELRAAKRVLATVLADDYSVVYSKAILAEWRDKHLFDDDMVVRTLEDLGKLHQVEPLRLTGGQRRDLGRFVDPDDQPFILAAGAITSQRVRPCVTRDPKTTRKESRRHVKATFSVTVFLASEYAATGA